MFNILLQCYYYFLTSTLYYTPFFKTSQIFISSSSSSLIFASLFALIRNYSTSLDCLNLRDLCRIWGKLSFSLVFTSYYIPKREYEFIPRKTGKIPSFRLSTESALFFPLGSISRQTCRRAAHFCLLLFPRQQPAKPLIYRFSGSRAIVK